MRSIHKKLIFIFIGFLLLFVTALTVFLNLGFVRMGERPTLIYRKYSPYPHTGRFYLHNTWGNENIKEEGYCKNGLIVGEHKAFFDNGQLCFINYYNSKNERDGVSKEWYKNGQKSYEETYKSDLSDGFAYNWDKKGNLIEKCFYKKSFKIYEETFFNTQKKQKFYFLATNVTDRKITHGIMLKGKNWEGTFLENNKISFYHKGKKTKVEEISKYLEKNFPRIKSKGEIYIEDSSHPITFPPKPTRQNSMR